MKTMRTDRYLTLRARGRWPRARVCEDRAGAWWLFGVPSTSGAGCPLSLAPALPPDHARGPRAAFHVAREALNRRTER